MKFDAESARKVIRGTARLRFVVLGRILVPSPAKPGAFDYALQKLIQDSLVLE